MVLTGWHVLDFCRLSMFNSSRTAAIPHQCSLICCSPPPIKMSLACLFFLQSDKELVWQMGALKLFASFVSHVSSHFWHCFVSALRFVFPKKANSTFMASSTAFIPVHSCAGVDRAPPFSSETADSDVPAREKMVGPAGSRCRVCLSEHTRSKWYSRADSKQRNLHQSLTSGHENKCHTALKGTETWAYRSASSFVLQWKCAGRV